MSVVLAHRRFHPGKKSIVPMLMSFVGCLISMLHGVMDVMRNFFDGHFLVNITVEVGNNSIKHRYIFLLLFFSHFQNVAMFSVTIVRDLA